jgi:hypothetical protein
MRMFFRGSQSCTSEVISLEFYKTVARDFDEMEYRMAWRDILASEMRKKGGERPESRNDWYNKQIGDKRGIRRLQVCTQYLYQDFIDQSPFQVMQDGGKVEHKEYYSCVVHR